MMNIEEIKNWIPHRYPFLMIDRILELEAGKKCRALKNVTGNEFFFQGHFPGNPIMPGVLIVEAMAQTAGFISYTMEKDPENKVQLFVGFEKVRFKKPVVPGDQLILDTEFVSHKMNLWVYRGSATVDGSIVAQAEFRLVTVEKLPSS